MTEPNQSHQSRPSGLYVIPLQEDRRTNSRTRRLSLPNTVYIDIPEPGSEVPENTQRSVSRQLLLSSESFSHNPLWTPGRATDTGTPATSAAPANSHMHLSSESFCNNAPWRPDRGHDNYVEQTIFYDPFDDRRIDVVDGKFQTRPNQLPLACNHTSPSMSSPSSLVTYAQQPYTQSPSDDGFHLTPLPVSDTPEPPPAYTEIDTRLSDSIVSPIPGLHISQAPVDGSRKLLTCPFCRQRVYTLVVRESGVITHVIAVIVFCFCFLLMLCVYFLNLCKYKNHYCPNCNNLIGYEIPLLCTEMVYSQATDQRL